MSKLPEQDEKPKVPEEKQLPEAQEEGMTLWEHLEELRGRLVKMIVAFLIGCVVAWNKKELLLELITKPFVEAWKKGLTCNPISRRDEPRKAAVEEKIKKHDKAE